MLSCDYQWPGREFKNSVLEKAFSGNVDKSIQDIEKYFENKTGYRCYLFPSARSGLRAILLHKEINRKNTIFAPKWSSHCLWDVITSYANPSSDYSSDVDIVVRVNKWGHLYSTRGQNEGNKIVINDSVDSLFVTGHGLLENSDYEIISLPKTLGLTSGGIVITTDSTFEKTVCSLRKKSNPKKSDEQFKRKVSYVQKGGAETPWEPLEAFNLGLSREEVSLIGRSLDNWDKNVDIIQKRLSFLGIEKDDRLPCLVPLKKKNVRDSNKFMKRMFNFSYENETDIFEEAYLLPLHFGVSEESFQRLASEIIL